MDAYIEGFVSAAKLSDPLLLFSFFLACTLCIRLLTPLYAIDSWRVFYFVVLLKTKTNFVGLQGMGPQAVHVAER